MVKPEPKETQRKCKWVKWQENMNYSSRWCASNYQPPISSIRACGSRIHHAPSHKASTSALQAIQFQRPGHAPKFRALLISDMWLLRSAMHCIRRHRASLHTPPSCSPLPPPILLLSSPARPLHRSLRCCLGRFREGCVNMRKSIPSLHRLSRGRSETWWWWWWWGNVVVELRA